MLSKNSYKIFLIISVASFEVAAAGLYGFSKIGKSPKIGLSGACSAENRQSTQNSFNYNTMNAWLVQTSTSEPSEPFTPFAIKPLSASCVAEFTVAFVVIS